MDLTTYPERPKTRLWVKYLIVSPALIAVMTLFYSMTTGNHFAWVGVGYAMIGLLWVIRSAGRNADDEYQELMREWSKNPFGDNRPPPPPPPSTDAPGYLMVRK